MDQEKKDGYSWKHKKFVDIADYLVSYKRLVIPHEKNLTGITFVEDLEMRFIDNNPKGLRRESVNIYLAGLGREACFLMDTNFMTGLGRSRKSQAVYYKHKQNVFEGQLSTGEFRAWQYALQGGIVTSSNNRIKTSFCCVSPSALCFKSTGRPTGYVLMTVLIGDPCAQVHGIVYVQPLDICIRVRDLHYNYLTDLWTNPNVPFDWTKALK